MLGNLCKKPAINHSVLGKRKYEPYILIRILKHQFWPKFPARNPILPKDDGVVTEDQLVRIVS